MRALTLSLITAAGLALAACGGEQPEVAKDESKPAETEAAESKATMPAAPAPASSGESAAAGAESRTLVMELKTGKVVIELRPDLAPKHVERIRKLTKEGFYNGIVFHRVIDGFMAQTGDPTGTGMGGSEYDNLAAEFTSTPFVRGTLGAARAKDKDSANSQFFICFTDTGCGSLTGSYTVFGRVAEGMEHIDQIKKGDRAKGGQVAGPDRIEKMYLR